MCVNIFLLIISFYCIFLKCWKLKNVGFMQLIVSEALVKGVSQTC